MVRATSSHQLGEIELLVKAFESKYSPFDILPEIRIVPHDYTLFVYNHILMSGKGSSSEVWEEYQKVNESDTYEKIYLLGTKTNPEKYGIYRELKTMLKLKYIDEYLEITKTRFEEDKIDQSEINEFNNTIINNFFIDIISISERKVPVLRCSKEIAGKIETFVIVANYRFLHQIISSNIQYVEKIVEIIGDKITINNHETIHIELYKILGHHLSINDIFLDVTKADLLNKYVSWVQENKDIYYVNQIFYKPKLSKTSLHRYKIELERIHSTLVDSYEYYRHNKSLKYSEPESRKIAGLQDELLFKQAYFLYKRKNPPEEIQDDKIKRYVFKNLDAILDSKDYNDILDGFWNKWNDSVFEIVGDGDYKNAVYRHLESLEKEKPIQQTVVDKVVDLVLDYLESIGQWD